jgi:phenylalanine-4-hydroxylase
VVLNGELAGSVGRRDADGMFEEGQLYSPVTEADDGTVTVHLAPNHPGANDPHYLTRRGEIAKAALRWHPGEPVPQIEYTDAEHEVWRTVCRELTVKHRALAHSAYLEAWERVGLPTDRVPQLDEVTARVQPLTGFTFDPAPGLVPLRQFYGSLADRTFHSTQYLRHPAQPLYTPEPDLVHEVIGHGNLLADPAIAEVKRLAGEAARRCETAKGLQFLADVFWFTIEFGVMWEDGELRCYGAGLLSSYGEIDEFRSAEVRPLDFLEMGTAEYDITHYQPVLYRADSLEHLMDAVGGFFAGMDDETPDRLARQASHV